MLKINLLMMALVFSLGFQASAQAVKQAGVVVLGGKKMSIVLNTDKMRGKGSIALGREQFEVFGIGNDAIEGKLVVNVNGKVKSDKNIQVIYNKADERALKEFVDNKAEVKCDSAANAMVIVGDNLKNTVVGNCATLVTK